MSEDLVQTPSEQADGPSGHHNSEFEAKAREIIHPLILYCNGYMNSEGSHCSQCKEARAKLIAVIAEAVAIERARAMEECALLTEQHKSFWEPMTCEVIATNIRDLASAVSKS